MKTTATGPARRCMFMLLPALMFSVCLAAQGDAVPERTRTIANTGPVIYPFVPVNLNIAPGEKLEYEARWMGFPAGSLTIECRWRDQKEDHEVYYLRAKINFNNIANPFYNVDNEAISIINCEDGSSEQFTLKRDEGKIKQRENVIYNYDDMVAVYTRRSPNKPEEKHQVSVQLLDKVVDPLSFFYYLRGVDLKPNKDINLLVNTSQRNWNMTLKTLKRTKVTVPLGEFDALKIEPVASFPGLIERKGRMYIYVEENTHIPLLISTDIPIGSISFALKSAKNSPLDTDKQAVEKDTPAEPKQEAAPTPAQ